MFLRKRVCAARELFQDPVLALLVVRHVFLVSSCAYWIFERNLFLLAGPPSGAP